jgi:hypothetical protein
MGLLRVILRADNCDSEDDGEYNAHYNDMNRRTVHGSRPKGTLSALGGQAMVGRGAKPNGFLRRDPGRPDKGGRP